MIFRYVIHRLVPAYEALGWVATGLLTGTHHGHWSELMEWKGDGEPVEPKAVADRKQLALDASLDVLAAHMDEVGGAL